MNEQTEAPKWRTGGIFWVYETHAMFWIRKQRNQSKGGRGVRAGVNANLIILAAVCIEGCAVECVRALLPDKLTQDRLESRLWDDLHSRIANAPGLAAISDIFRVLFGKTLRDSVPVGLRDPVAALISFRNYLAHGRSIALREDATGTAYSRGYKIVDEYLSHRGLLQRTWLGPLPSTYDLLTDEIADHFIDVTKPVCQSIAALLSAQPAKEMQEVIAFAFAFGDEHS